MTHKNNLKMINIALYEPDIPQNTAAIIRTCACLGADLEIIENQINPISIKNDVLFRLFKKLQFNILRIVR